MGKEKRLLIIEPHSDDSALGAQGLIHKLVKQGYEAFFVVIAVSDTTFHHCGLVTAQQRREEYRNYVKYMNGTWIHDDFPIDEDTRLDRLERRALVYKLERIIKDVDPDILLCQAPSFHQDHTATYEAVMAAIRPTAQKCPREILLMENATYVHSLGPSTDFKPTTYCALSEEDMVDKIRCFRECFPSQIRNDKTNNLSIEGMQVLAKYRALECRAEHYAEAFVTYLRRLG